MNRIIKIGVTGHRDLKQECLEYYKKQVYKLLVNLKSEHSNVVIYSPLSDGADRLVVQEGMKLDIPFVAVLPVPKDKYLMDFNESSLEEFESLLNKAQEIITMPLCNNSTLDEVSSYSKQRDRQYEACGHFIADCCDNLIALWDQKFIGLVGGTGEVVKYYLQTQDKGLFHLLVSRSKDIKNNKIEFKEIKSLPVGL